MTDSQFVNSPYTNNKKITQFKVFAKVLKVSSPKKYKW